MRVMELPPELVEACQGVAQQKEKAVGMIKFVAFKECEKLADAFEDAKRQQKTHAMTSGTQVPWDQCLEFFEQSKDWTKERAQKVRLQQQIASMQKRLLQTQIHELQNNVLIGGKKIDADDASAAAEDADHVEERVPVRLGDKHSHHERRVRADARGSGRIRRRELCEVCRGAQGV